LDFAAFWSDLLFSTADDFSLFFYELLRNEAILDKLGELTNASETNEKPHGRLGPSGRAAESARNLRAIVAHFSSRLDEFKETSRVDQEPEIDDVLAIVNHSSEKLDLVESAALEDFRYVFTWLASSLNASAGPTQRWTMNGPSSNCTG
jgi:hypothetical protein